MKAITTRYLSCTPTKPTRIKASDGDGNSITITEDSSKVEAHKKAADALIEKMGWSGFVVTGWQKPGVYVHCFIEHAAEIHSAGVRPVRWLIHEDKVAGNVYVDETQGERGNYFAIRRLGDVMNFNGEWEYEPMPSNRDDAFYARCRFAGLTTALAVFKGRKD